MHQGRYNDDYARRTMNPARGLYPERWISFDGRNHSVTPWCIPDFIFHYTCSLKNFITPAYSYYTLLLFPGCYGHVYVFRILGVIMQL
jgi:hypothetical protein